MAEAQRQLAGSAAARPKCALPQRQRRMSVVAVLWRRSHRWPAVLVRAYDSSVISRGPETDTGVNSLSRPLLSGPRRRWISDTSNAFGYAIGRKPPNEGR